MGENPNKTKVDRRSFMAASAAGAAVVTAAPSVMANSGRASRFVGASLDQGWTVGNVDTGLAGAVRFELNHKDMVSNIHVLVCRTEKGSRPMASTAVTDLFLMNNGRNGETRTPESYVSAVKSLAKHLAGREESLPGFSKMMGQSERLKAFDPIDHADPLAPHE